LSPPGHGPAPPAAVDDDGEDEWEDPSGPEVVGVEARPDAADVVHRAECHAADDGGLKLGEDQQVERSLVDGPDPPEHVGVSSAEFGVTRSVGMRSECGEVEAASEVVELRGRAQFREMRHIPLALLLLHLCHRSIHGCIQSISKPLI